MDYKIYSSDPSATDGFEVDWRSYNPNKRQPKLRLFMLPRLYTSRRNNVAALYNLISRRLTSTGRADATPLREPALLSAEDQWARATGVIAAAIATFGYATKLQAGAARQLDAADYALQHLLAELGAAMPIAALKTSLVPATVQTPPDAAAVPDEALAA